MNSRRLFPWLMGILAGATMIALIAFAGACDEGNTAGPAGPGPAPGPGPGPSLVTASDWVSSVDWATATVVQLDMVEGGGSAYSFSPSNMTFEAGRPYIMRITNPASNQEKHYFATEGLGDFYKVIATRKIQTADAEYKAPHFEAVELLIGGSLEIYFVPVLGGTYDFLCTIPGHAPGGMVGQITITGGEGNVLDLEIASDFNMGLTQDARKSGGHSVWESAVETEVVIWEEPYSFRPPDLALQKDVGYKLTLSNPAGARSKHYYTASDFYRTVVVRKSEDSQAEIKPLYFKAVELLIGGSTELFIVPTAAGTFEALCTIEGHAAAGMIGTVVVSP